MLNIVKMIILTVKYKEIEIYNLKMSI